MSNTPNTNSTPNPCKVITGRGRFTYFFGWEAREPEDGGDPKFSTGFLIPKSDVNTLQNIDRATQAAIQLGVEKGYWKSADRLPADFKFPMRDGDLLADERGEEYAGHWFITASSKTAPDIVDINRQHILNQEEVYSGAYGRLSINLFPFNNKSKGIGVALNHVQKLFDGDPLTAIRSKAEEDFADWSDGSGDLFDDDASAAPGATGNQPGYVPQFAASQGGQAPQYAPQGQAPQQYAPQGQPPAQQGYAPQYAPQGQPPQQYAPQGQPPAQQGYAPQHAPQGQVPQQYTPQGQPAVQQGYAPQYAPQGQAPQQYAPQGQPPAQQQAPQYPPQGQQAPQTQPGDFSARVEDAARNLPDGLFGDERQSAA